MDLSPCYYAGFPYFPLDACKALLDWNLIVGDEVAHRLAIRAARGVATDFAVISGEADRMSNKGAFWDRMMLGANGKPEFADSNGDLSHWIVSNARIARTLLELYSLSKERLFLQAALNACHWLILKQNADGFYSGDCVDGHSGAVRAIGTCLGGAEAIRPLIGAYKITKNEVYIKAARKIARKLMDASPFAHPAPPLFAVSNASERDCPVMLAAIVQAAAALYTEAPNKELRDFLAMSASWLRACAFDPAAIPSLDYDGLDGGRHECALAAYRMFTVDRDTQWLRLGHALVRSTPPEARASRHAVAGFLASLLCLAPLLAQASANLDDYTVTMGWRRYRIDPATRDYIFVTSAGHAGPAAMDFLPLVSQDSQLLLLVLAHLPIETVSIFQSTRRPVAKDLISGELIDYPTPLHPLPYPSEGSYGIFTVDP
jgi:hypothetical protein